MRDCLSVMKKKVSICLALCGALAMTSSASAVVIYSDNFDDNINTGWTYLDRSAGTTIVTGVGGGPGAPVLAEQNQRLEQTVANYSFPNGVAPDGDGGPQIGAMALSGAGVVGGQYTISVDMDSLEEGNGFQDQDIVFGYTDEDNFFYVETIANGGGNLFSVIAGVRTNIGGSGITFSHDPTNVILTVDTAAGDVSLNYGGAGDASLVSGAALAAGQVGVGSNNDAFAIDNFVVEQIPEPTSIALLGLSGLLTMLVRRK